MSKVNAEFIERFQIEYEKNPRSRVFAALAEAYRKMGLLDEANRLCMKGVQIHPSFAGGRVAYAKVLIDLKKPDQALVQLEKAIEISPENLLAHSLTGEVLLQLRRPKDALKAYKMTLFLNPNDEKAKAVVNKWEFLSADEYEDELFAMKPVFAMDKKRSSRDEAPGAPKVGMTEEAKIRALERAVSLADAFTVRGEPEKALAVVMEARNKIGSNPELDRRIELLSRRAAEQAESDDDYDDADDDTDSDVDDDSELDLASSPSPIENYSDVYGVDPKEKMRMKLETFLRRIEARRLGG